MKKLRIFAGFFIILLGLTAFVLSCGNAAKPAEVSVWHPSDIVGQGRLVDVEMGSCRWCISLELRAAATLEGEVFVYCASEELTVGNIGKGHPIGLLEFREGAYYVLYRVIEGGETRYHLAER